MYTYTNIYTNAYTHTYIHTYINICMHAHIHTYIQKYMHTHTYMHTYIHPNIHTYEQTYMHIYIHVLTLYIEWHSISRLLCKCITWSASKESTDNVYINLTLYMGSHTHTHHFLSFLQIHHAMIYVCRIYRDSIYKPHTIYGVTLHFPPFVQMHPAMICIYGIHPAVVPRKILKSQLCSYFIW